MKRHVLRNYLQRRVGLQILALLAVLMALMQLLELLDVTGDVLQRGLGLRGLVRYAWLRAPAELVLALPMAVLLGAMTSLQAMARSLEIATIRAAGIGMLRLYAILLPLALLLAVVQVALTERVLPRAENALKAWWQATAPPDEAPKRRWAHTSGGPVSIDAGTPDGRRLQGVRIYERDADGRLTARIAAREAVWTGGGAWELHDAVELDVAAGPLRRSGTPMSLLRSAVATRVWRSNLSPDDVLRLDVARPRLSSMMLADVIAGERTGTQPLSYYRALLARSFTAPLTIFIMLLLALPVAAGALTRAKGGGGMLVVLLLGLAYLLGDGIVGALGTSGRLEPLTAALAMPLAFITIGLLRLQASERP